MKSKNLKTKQKANEKIPGPLNPEDLANHIPYGQLLHTFVFPI